MRRILGLIVALASVGTLTVSAVMPTAAAAGSGAPSAARASTAGVTRTYTIEARNWHWRDTRWNLPAGSTVTFAVTGNATCHAPSAPDCLVDHPQGIYLCATNPFVPHSKPGPAGPAVRYDALAARFGAHGKPFAVGRRRTVHASGVLYLVFNDCNPPGGYSDNAGAFVVRVTRH